ncbi:hypothetical protein Bbelb_370370 [Branchiostoma belcheri]|nr:hypothetical protein Bbelb_370370 [Branchiostoma belcheri]
MAHGRDRVDQLRCSALSPRSGQFQVAARAPSKVAKHSFRPMGISIVKDPKMTHFDARTQKGRRRDPTLSLRSGKFQVAERARRERRQVEWGLQNCDERNRTGRQLLFHLIYYSVKEVRTSGRSVVIG